MEFGGPPSRRRMAHRAELRSHARYWNDLGRFNGIHSSADTWIEEMEFLCTFSLFLGLAVYLVYFRAVLHSSPNGLSRFDHIEFLRPSRWPWPFSFRPLIAYRAPEHGYHTPIFAVSMSMSVSWRLQSNIPESNIPDFPSLPHYFTRTIVDVDF